MKATALPDLAQFAAACWTQLRAGRSTFQLHCIVRQVEFEFLRTGGRNHTTSAGRRRRSNRKEP